jgi:hypothetical protein
MYRSLRAPLFWGRLAIWAFPLGPFAIWCLAMVSTLFLPAWDSTVRFPRMLIVIIIWALTALTTFGTVAAVVALRRRESHRWLAVIALILNAPSLALLVISLVPGAIGRFVSFH